MTVALGRRLAAEFLGTAFLLAIVVGSGIMGASLAPDNDAIALLGNTLATAAGLIVLIAILGPVSGAHFNPAVTLVFALRREIAPLGALAYAAVQTLGAVAGVLLAHAMFDMELVQAATTPRPGLGRILAEAVATFGLILTILGSRRLRPEIAAAAVGLWVAAGYWFTSSTSFANPAVTLARTLTDTFAGVRPTDTPGFIVAQFAAALGAARLGSWLFQVPRSGYRAADAGAALKIPNAR